MMTKEKQKLQNDITNFILNDKITRRHRENILDDILEDFFSEQVEQQQQQQAAAIAQQQLNPGQGPSSVQDIFAQIAAGQ